MSAVGIKESALDIYYLLASPLEHKSRLLCNYRNLNRLKVFLCGITHELIKVLRIQDNCHSLLRL